MSLYFENYSLKEKLYELGKLSARKKALEDSFSSCKLTNNKTFKQIQSGNIVNVIELYKLVDQLLDEISE